MPKILVLEDDSTFAAILEGFLKKKGFEVIVRNSLKAGLEAVLKDDFQLLLMDYRLGDGIALDLFTHFAQQEKDLPPSIIMTSFHDVRTAVKAIRQGVYDYITKPINPDELLIVVQEALATADNTKQGKTVSDIASDSGEASHPSGPEAGRKRETPAQRRVRDFENVDYVEGTSQAANKLQDYIALVAPTDMSVLIRGESGTGKEYVARSIHRLSKRANKPFVSIDCGTLSKELASSELFGHAKGAFTGAVQDKIGQFQHASGGTLFLDEIGNLSYDVQVKLLRTLQEGVIQPVGTTKLVDVDVRIIAATNEDLIGAQFENRFREDLYHRLNEFEIQVPALRNRKEDFHEFVRFFVEKANDELGRGVIGPSEEVLEVWKAYDWPGNLRELRNTVRRMVLLTKGTVSGLETLPEDMVLAVQNEGIERAAAAAEEAGHLTEPLGNLVQAGGEVDLKQYNEQHERNLIIEVLNQTRFNKSKAAKMLNIDRKTLYNKMEKYGIF